MTGALFRGPRISFFVNRSREEKLQVMRDVTFVFMTIWLYATFVYPIVPAMLGGGRRPVVELFMKESPYVTAAISSDIKHDKNHIGPVRLMSID